RRLVRRRPQRRRGGRRERRTPRRDRGWGLSPGTEPTVPAPRPIPGETHQIRRLLPDVADTTVAEQLHGLDLTSLAKPERPYLVLNFVTTLDGRATIDGKSGPIGDRTDTEMLQRLRTRVDAVMIGAGTMRVERYGRIVSDPQLRAYRERTGLAHDPLAVLVSN